MRYGLIGAVAVPAMFLAQCEPACEPVVPPPPSPAHYENCTAAWNAGAAPVYIGDPGYADHLDRDGDGIGCEVDPR